MASSNPQESLYRATSGESQTNYAAIMRGFMAKGIPESEIQPRVNVFTFNAWKANGRIVKRGEHGVRCLTFIDAIDKQTGQRKRRPWSTTVFHVSQTEPIGTRAITYPDAATNTPDAWRNDTPAPRRAQNTYETMTDEALAALAASGRGKALIQLTESECSAMMEQMRRAQHAKEVNALAAEIERNFPLHAGQAVNILDLMPDKIDQRPGQPTALKPTIKRREFKF